MDWNGIYDRWKQSIIELNKLPSYLLNQWEHLEAMHNHRENLGSNCRINIFFMKTRNLSWHLTLRWIMVFIRSITCRRCALHRRDISIVFHRRYRRNADSSSFKCVSIIVDGIFLTNARIFGRISCENSFLHFSDELEDRSSSSFSSSFRSDLTNDVWSKKFESIWSKNDGSSISWNSKSFDGILLECIDCEHEGDGDGGGELNSSFSVLDEERWCSARAFSFTNFGIRPIRTPAERKRSSEKMIIMIIYLRQTCLLSNICEIDMIYSDYDCQHWSHIDHRNNIDIFLCVEYFVWKIPENFFVSLINIFALINTILLCILHRLAHHNEHRLLYPYKHD